MNVFLIFSSASLAVDAFATNREAGALGANHMPECVDAAPSYVHETVKRTMERLPEAADPSLVPDQLRKIALEFKQDDNVSCGDLVAASFCGLGEVKELCCASCQAETAEKRNFWNADTTIVANKLGLWFGGR